MTTIDFNTKPYFDDFDDSKNYQKILFKPSFAVQARELTQLQTISQNQIKKLADVSLSNGDRLSPGELIYSNKISYVQMAFNSAANIVKTISSPVTAGTSGYVSANGVSTTGGTGTGLTVNTTASSGSVSAITIANGGSDYSVGDTITITGGSGDATFTITALHAGIANSDLVGSYIGSSIVAAVNTISSVVSGGSGYSNASDVATTGGTGTGLTVTITTSGNAVNGITVVNRGSGYTVGDTITITGGGGNATFTVSTLVVSSPIKAKIVHYEPSVTGGSDAFTLYVSYLNSSTSQAGLDDSDFKFLNSSDLFQLNSDGTVGTNLIGKTGASSTGFGSAILLKTGSYYVNGYIATVPSQVMVLDKFGTTPSYRVGFNVSQSFATSDDDSTLLDNASGSSNKGAGGADRHKIQLVLAKKSLTPDSTANEDFVEILKVVSGKLIEKEQGLDQKLLGDNKILDPYEIEIRENLSTLTDAYGLKGVSSGGSSSKLSVGISSGSIQFNGKKVSTSSKQYVTIDKSRESKTYANFSIGAEVGSYVITRGGLEGVEVQTSGFLKHGESYTITTFVSGDDFTNLGASANSTGQTFTATGTTPTTWTNGSTLTKQGLSGEYIKWLGRIFTNGSSEGYVKVNLVKFSAAGSPSVIGYARIRGIKQHTRSNNSDFHGECRIYLTDINFSNDSYNMTEVVALQTAYSSGNRIICYLETDRIDGPGNSIEYSNVEVYGKDNTHTILHDVKYDKSFYPLGVSNVKAIGSVSPQRIRWSGSVTIGGSNASTVTFTAPTGYYFVDGTEHEVVAYGTWSHEDSSGPFNNGTAAPGGSPIALSGSSSVTEYEATISDSTDNTLVLTARYRNSDQALTFKASTPVTVVADIIPTSAWTSGNTLALQQNTEIPSVISGTGNEGGHKDRVIRLSQPRVLEKNFKVYMSRDNDTAVGSSPFTDDIDISDWYTIDSGMRDNLVMNGTLVRKAGYPEPRGLIKIIYFFLNETNNNKYIGVDSYPVGSSVSGWVSAEDGGTTFRYSDIPTYTSELGETYRLSDVLDFRPTITADSETAAVDDTKPLVSEASSIHISNLEVYQSRIDKIYIKDDGTPAVSVGSSYTDYPNIPSDPNDGLSIFNIKVLPYTHDTKDVVIQKIGDSLKSHVGELAKFSLEGVLQNNSDSHVLDSATCKTNTLSDAFYGSGSGNIKDPDNNISYDLVNHSIRPKFTETEIKFSCASGTSTDLLTSSNLVTLPTTSTSEIEIQNIASSTSDTIRSTDVDTYHGHMTLTPSFDSWKSTKSNPEILFNENGVYNSVETSNHNTIWDGWKDNWYGTHQSSCFEKPSFGSGFSPQLDFCSGVNYSSDSGALVPFIQNQQVTLKVDGLKPSTVGHKIYLDDIDISDSVIYKDFGSNTNYYDSVSCTFRSDTSGTFCGTYTIPNKDEGTYAIKLSSSTNEFINGDLVYQGPSIDRATATAEVVCWVGGASTGFEKVLHLKNVSGEFSSGCVYSEGVTLSMASMNSGTNFTVGERVSLTANAGCSYAQGFSFGLVTGWSGSTCVLEITSLTGADFSSCQSCFVKGETSNSVGVLETTANNFCTVATGCYDSIVGGEKIKTGKRIFKVESTDSYSEAVFDATGKVEIGRTLPYDYSWDDQTQNSLSQVIDVKEPFFATSVDLYFNCKDINYCRPITVQLREVENGAPSNKVIPYTTVTKTPSSVTCTSNGTTATNFGFSEKIYLGKGQYAITISTNAMEYSLMSLDINSGKGARTIDVGSMFRGTKEVPDKIIKFSLKRATFNTSPSTSSVVLKNNDLPDVILNENSFSVNNSAAAAIPLIQYICLDNYGFSVNDKFLMDGIRGKQGHKLTIATGSNWDIGARVDTTCCTTADYPYNANNSSGAVVSRSGTTYVIYPGTSASGSYGASGVTWGSGTGQCNIIYCTGMCSSAASSPVPILDRFINGISICDLNTHSLACCKNLIKALTGGNNVIAPIAPDAGGQCGMWETLSPFENRIVIRNSNVRSDGEYYHIPEIVPEYTNLSWELSDNSSFPDNSTTCNLTPNDNFYRGKSFKISGSSHADQSCNLFLRACMTSSCNKVSPVFNFQSMRAIAISNIVDNSNCGSSAGALGCVNFKYSGNVFCDTTYSTPSFFISKTLQVERPANAVKVLVDAIVPYCSDLKIYGRTSGNSSGLKSGGTSTLSGYHNYGHQSHPYSEISPVNCISANDGLEFKTIEYKKTCIDPFYNINLKLDLSAGDTSRVPIIRGLRVIPYSEECELKPLETFVYRDCVTVNESSSCCFPVVTNFEVSHGEIFIVKENGTSFGCPIGTGAFGGSNTLNGTIVKNGTTGVISPYKYDGTGASVCFCNTHAGSPDSNISVEYMLFLYGRRN